MTAKQTSNPEIGDANRTAEVAGRIPPGLTLMGFRDASRLAFRDKGSRQASASGRNVRPKHIHAAFTGLIALGSIAMLVLGR